MAASALATLAVAVIVVALWGLWSMSSPGPPARHGAATTVILRHGATLPEIASNLEDSGVVRSASIFMAAAQATGAARALKAGEYAFPSRASLGQVLTMIRQGRIVHHAITIPEGLTSAEAVDILNASDVLTGPAVVPPEGSLLPETYEVQRGDTRAGVLRRMMAARDRLIAELWPRRRADLPFKTPEEAVTLASVVEKETGVAAERPRVAAVFVNRLVKGMRLESDPTVIYAVSQGRPLGRGLRQSELLDPSPYNTYMNAGLPPTPICNPGRASIAAVLDPPRTDELYFVANGTGGHSFAATLEEHVRNVQRWRQIEQAQRAPALAGAAPAAGTVPLRGEATHAR
ncbi:MAG: endolytic transglycosylase MltG [Caulobacteraceae bacterium]